MNITLLIATCDSYLKFIPNCIKLADKYFEGDIPRKIIGESVNQEYNGYEFITTKQNDWGERLLIGLNTVETKYVFFILEDYYFSEKLSEKYLKRLIKFMDDNKAKKLMISPVPDFVNYNYTDTFDEIKKINLNSDSNYLASIQPSIWDVEHLKSILKVEYSPWDFELEASKTLKGKEFNYYVIKLKEPIYFNFVRKGGIKSKGWQDFLNKEELKL